MDEDGFTLVTSKRNKPKPPPGLAGQKNNYPSRDLRNFLRKQREMQAEFEEDDRATTGRIPPQNAGIFRNFQDTKEVVFRKKQAPKTERVRKPGGAQRRKGGQDEARRLAKLDETNDAGHHKMVKKDLSRKIQAFRQQHHMSQAELAQKVNVREEVIRRYEKGEGIPDQEVIQKLHRYFQVAEKQKPTQE